MSEKLDLEGLRMWHRNDLIAKVLEQQAALERVPELERDEWTARDETAGLADYLKHVEAILDGERDRANAAGRRAERVEAALVAVREQERDEDWFPEDRPVSLVHLAHLQEPNPDCVLCACETGETIGG